MDILPPELVCEIFKQLTDKEKIELALTSKREYNILETNKNSLFKLDFIYYYHDCKDHLICDDYYYQIKVNKKRLNFNILSEFLLQRIKSTIVFTPPSQDSIYLVSPETAIKRVNYITYSSKIKMISLFRSNSEKDAYFIGCMENDDFQKLVRDIRDEVRKKIKLNLKEIKSNKIDL